MNDLDEIKKALDAAGVAIGNEHEIYTLAERVKRLAVSRDYFVRQTDIARYDLARAERA